MDKFNESVNGTVVGGIATVGQLYYSGRPQGQHIYSYDGEQMLKTNARYVKERIKAECGQAYSFIYPEDSLWELRIFN